MNWISIKDSLPEFNKYVLVILNIKYGFGEYSSQVEIARYCCRDGWTIDKLGDEKFIVKRGLSLENISHWMELPVIKQFEDEEDKDELED